MNEQESAALDRYLTTPPDELESDEVDETEGWNVDDFCTVVDENDWVFIMYFKFFNTKLHQIVQRKFVGTQEGFMTALDTYGPENLITEKLEIISGKEWLKNR